MTQCTADFELGTNGNSIQTSDTGSATAWDTILRNGTSTIKYDTTHVVDTLAAKYDSASANTCYLRWTTAFGTVTDHYGRMYVYLTANPASAMPIIEFGQGSTRGARIDINATGTLRGFDNPAAALFPTTTNSIALNQWIRLEWHIIHSATVGQGEIKLFNTASSTTATETSTGAANKNTLANATTATFGDQGGPTSTVFWADSIVAGAASYPGPVTPAATNYQPGFRYGFL